MKNNKKKNKKISNTKMDKKTKSFVSFVFAIVFLFLLFSLYAIRLQISNKSLDKEFDKLLEVDVTKANYNKRLESIGKYRKTEKALKDYFNIYSSKINEVLDTINSDEFSSLFEIDTFKKNKDDMQPLIDYSINTKEKLDKTFKEINIMVKYDYIKSYSNQKIDKESSRKLFMYYMTSKDAKNYFESHNESVLNKQEEVNNILDVSRDLYYFLIINKDNWIIKDNQIQFSNNMLMNQYNEYIKKIS